MRLNHARLRLARYNAGMTQTKLAMLAGLTPGYVSDLERGVRNGSAASLKAIADVLGVTVAYLLDVEVISGSTGESDAGATACG